MILIVEEIPDKTEDGAVWRGRTVSACLVEQKQDLLALRRELQERVVGESEVLRAENCMLKSENREIKAQNEKLRCEAHALRREVEIRDEKIEKLKALFANHRAAPRGSLSPASRSPDDSPRHRTSSPSSRFPAQHLDTTGSPSSTTHSPNPIPSTCSQSPPIGHEQASKHSDEGMENGGAEDAGDRSRSRPAGRRRSQGEEERGGWSRTERERRALEKVDIQRRSVQMRKEAEAMFEKTLKARDDEIKRLEEKLADATKQLEGKLARVKEQHKTQMKQVEMQHEQELFIAKQALTAAEKKAFKLP